MSGTLEATVFACTVNSINRVTEKHHHDTIALCYWKAFFFSLAIFVLSVLCLLTVYFVKLLLLPVFKLTF